MAAAAALALGTAAYADGFGVNGYGEYALEAQAFEFGVGATYDVDAFTLYADTVFNKPSGAALDFTEATLGVSYTLNENADVYTEATFNNSFNYQELTIGVSLQY